MYWARPKLLQSKKKHKQIRPSQDIISSLHMNAVLDFFFRVEPKYQQYVQNLTHEFQSNLVVHLRHFQVQCLESVQPWGI